MLNRAQFEGTIVKLWGFQKETFARVVHTPDPGQGHEDMLMTVRFPSTMPRSAFRQGDTVRAIGYIHNRRVSPEGAEKASYVCEIHADMLIRIARRDHQEATVPAPATEPAMSAAA